MTKTIQLARWGLTALLGLAANGAAHAEAGLSADALASMAPSALKEYVARQIARQQAQPLQGGALDVTPPTLTQFSAGTKLDLNKAAAPFKIVIKGTDDLSGLKSVGYQATGPSGQVISGAIDTAFPALSYGGNGGFAGGSQFLEKGAWKVTYAFGFDWAGNFFNLNEAALALLGNTSFTVSNPGGFDLVKPTLLTGSGLITPTVSLSAVAKGTASEDPSIGLKVKVSDAGNTAVAGVKSVSAIMCQLADPSTCLYPAGYTSATGMTSTTITIKQQVSAARGNVPGDYTLQSVTVMDHAGNFTSYTSTLFGGSTDFSTLFSATVIKLNP